MSDKLYTFLVSKGFMKLLTTIIGLVVVGFALWFEYKEPGINWVTTIIGLGFGIALIWYRGGKFNNPFSKTND